MNDKLKMEMWKNAMKLMKRNINGVRRTKSKHLFVEINLVDEDEMCFTIIGNRFWFHMHEQTLGSCLKWGSDKTLLDFFSFFNIKKSKGHMQKINVFIIDDHLGKFFKAMNDTILRENFIVSMMFVLHNSTFITFY